MERALKYTLVALLAIVVVVLGFVYGLYFAGARHISPDWRPTTAQYPEAARLALWRSYDGHGLPEGNPMSPPEYVWRWYFAGKAFMDKRPVDPRMTMAYRAARSAKQVGGGGVGGWHLMQAAASIRASRWPVEGQLDTVLDSMHLGEGVRGYRQGAMHVFGLPLERLDAAQLHLLITIAWAPGYFDPWCQRDRLRTRVFETAMKWRVPATTEQLEAALASIGPPPADSRCAGMGG
jgi:hypothetical protein